MARIAILALIVVSGCAREVDCEGTPLEAIPRSGLFVSPSPGAVAGPVDLVLGNNAGEPVRCSLSESDACPSLAPYVPSLESVADGACWRVDDVSCADVTLTCEYFSGELAAEWSWVVE